MKLSEAIRLGAMLRPQAFSTLFSWDGGSCAMGAAAEAAGLADVPYGYVAGAREKARALGWSWATEDGCCPVCGARFPLTANISRRTIEAAIVHLNNDHRWTREQIADWVETLESARQPASESATTTNAIDPVGGIVTG